MVDDELISAYIDGQLNSTDRAALEARMGQDAALQQQVATTRLLVGAARQLPVPSLPRYFALPDAYVRPIRRSGWDGRWLFRATSLLSAGLCAVLFAIDAGQWAGRDAQMPQAVARTMTPITKTLPQSSGVGTLPPAVKISTAATLPMPTLTNPPNSALQAKTMRSASVETAASTTSENAATPAVTAPTVTAPAAAAPVANTPEPTATPLTEALQTALPVNLPGPDSTTTTLTVSLLPRALAVLAGLAAMLFAGLGWRH